MKISDIINRVIRFYLSRYGSPEKYGRYLGVKIGKGTTVGSKIWSTEPYLITIGDNCQITANVQFHTHGGSHVARMTIPQFDCFGKIVVGNGVYIGTGSQIMPGVTIGDGCLVAAGSIVTKSIPPNSVVGGNPARYICTVNEYINKNSQYNVNTKGLSSNEKRHILEGLPPDKFIIKKIMK